jgi:hypothetical protein
VNCEDAIAAFKRSFSEAFQLILLVTTLVLLLSEQGNPEIARVFIVAERLSNV